jgi:hypothetical protein
MTTSLSSRDRAELLMRRRNLDPAPANWPEVVSSMMSDTMPGDRGWVLYGGVGSGKTARARVAADLCGIQLCEAVQLADEFRSCDPVVAARLPGGWQMPASRCGLADLIIDDLGAEPRSIMLWGERREPLREILEARLNRWPRIRTYLTTNLTPQELDGRYGERVASRVAGCCLPILLNAPDWRRRATDDAH